VWEWQGTVCFQEKLSVKRPSEMVLKKREMVWKTGLPAPGSMGWGGGQPKGAHTCTYVHACVYVRGLENFSQANCGVSALAACPVHLLIPRDTEEDGMKSETFHARCIDRRYNWSNGLPSEIHGKTNVREKAAFK
jgi:hypothetical protein